MKTYKVPPELLAVIEKAKDEKKEQTVFLRHKPSTFVSYTSDGSIQIDYLPASSAVSSKGRVYKTEEMQWFVYYKEPKL